MNDTTTQQDASGTAEKRESLKTLRADAQALRALLDNRRIVEDAMFQQAQVGMWLYAPNGYLEKANDYGIEMMGGVAYTDVDGFAVFDGWWADTHQKIGPHDWPVAIAIEHRRAMTDKLVRLMTFKRDEKYFNISAVPLTAEDGSNLGVLATAVDMTAQVHLEQELRQAQRQLAERSRSQLDLHEQQIAQISRNLHDDIGQTLSLLNLHLAAAERQEHDRSRMHQEILAAVPLVEAALAKLRTVCNELAPDELTYYGLSAGLRYLCQSLQDSTDLSFEFRELGSLPLVEKRIELALYRVAQQALTNVIEHANAKHVIVVLDWAPQAVSLSISDDGRGFDPGLVAFEASAQRLGIKNMTDRMRLLGGNLVIASTNQGTQVTASVHPTDLLASTGMS